MIRLSETGNSKYSGLLFYPDFQFVNHFKENDENGGILCAFHPVTQHTLLRFHSILVSFVVDQDFVLFSSGKCFLRILATNLQSVRSAFSFLHIAATFHV